MTPDPIREHSLERSLPHSAEAERAILGGVILDNGLIMQAVELLKPEDFYVPANRRIFVAMSAIFGRGGEISPLSIGEELKKENALESVGGISYIANTGPDSIAYGLPHSTNISHYAKVVRGKSYLRQLIKAANQTVQEALEQEDEPEIIGEHAEQRIFALRDVRTSRGRLEAVNPIARSVLELIQEQEGRHAVLTGITTGYTDLDRLTSGWQQQDLIILAARPGVGKTSLALMLAEHAAIQASAVVAIFSLEMSKKALVMRMLCSQANVDAQRFRNGFLSKPEWACVAKALGTLAEARIFLDDSPAMSVLEMRAKAMRLATEQKRLDMIVVDYLQLAKGGKQKYQSENQELTDISHDLKSLAKEMNVPLIALSQLSRKPEDRSDHRPQLSDLRGSGTIEQDADVVAFLYRADQYKPAVQRDNMPDDERNVCDVIVAKQRSGPTDVVKLRWTPSSMRFDNLYRE